MRIESAHAHPKGNYRRCRFGPAIHIYIYNVELFGHIYIYIYIYKSLQYVSYVKPSSHTPFFQTPVEVALSVYAQFMDEYVCDSRC